MNMRKVLSVMALIALTALIAASAAYAASSVNYIYFQDFEKSVSDGYCYYIDANQDGYFFNRTKYENFANNTYFMRSMSWEPNIGGKQGAGPLRPDDYLVIGPIALPEAASLGYDVCSQDPNRLENYSVYVYTEKPYFNSAEDNNLNKGEVLFTGKAEGLAPYSGKMTNKNFSLAKYAGQSVYIAFRHHDTYDKYWLEIDNVGIYTGTVIPATGDDTPLTLLAILLGGSFICIVRLITLKRRRET